MMKMAVEGCARCGGTHSDLIVSEFQRTPEGGWTHWATCPATGAPILIRMIRPSGVSG